MNVYPVSRRRSRQSGSFLKKRRRRLAVLAAASASAAAVVLFALSRLSYAPFLAIRSVEIAGAAADQAAAASAAAGALSGSYGRLFSKANAFLYPKSAVERAVASSSPAVDSVSARLSGLSKLVISVKERAPAAEICPNLPDFGGDGSLSASEPGRCYLADRNGFIYGRAAASSMASSTAGGAPGLDLYFDPDLPSDPVGAYATGTPAWRDLSSFVYGARAAGLPVRGVLIKEGGEYELYVENAASGTAVIYADRAGDLDEELSNLAAFWGRMVSAAPSGAKPGFQSVDVRYGSNVFYRLNR